MQTHRFLLLTGFEVQVRPMDGSHQTIITKNNHLTFPEKVSLIMEDLVDYVGATDKPDAKFFTSMLAGDRAKLMYELRQFSFDFVPDFDFVVEFEDPKTGRKEKKEFSRTLEHEIEDADGEKIKVAGLPMHPYPELQFEPMDDYTQIIKEGKYVEMVLPKSGKEIRMTLLDGYGEIIGAKTKKRELSSETLMQMRQPKEKFQAERSVQYIDSRHEKYNLVDLTYMRKTLKAKEGRVDSETFVKSPFDENEEQIVNILTNVSFFFPGAVV